MPGAWPEERTHAWQLPALQRKLGTRLALGFYVLVSSGLTMAVMAARALMTGEPWAFPSLGPTAFLLFYQPLAADAAPRSTFFGHLIGALCGYLALLVFGLSEAEPDLAAVSWARLGALALALALTLAFMVWLRVPHAPAGATTLIVASGLLRTPRELAILMAAVAALTVQGLLINRLAGIPYPLWKPLAAPAPHGPQDSLAGRD